MNNDYGAGLGYTMTEGFFGRKKKMRIFLSEEKQGETNKNKKDENTNKNDDKDNNINKDKFSYTSATGFFQKQLDE